MNARDQSQPVTVKVKIVSPLWRALPASNTASGVASGAASGAHDAALAVETGLLGEPEIAPATPGSAGADLRAAIALPVTITPGGRAKIPTGLAIEICAPGLAGLIFSRSGLGAKQGLTVAQGVGLIDPDYRGEIIVWLLNTSDQTRTVAPGERIAQLVIMPFAPAAFILAEDLGETSRGDGGFGHTGSH